jgi:hypothetical protein
LGKGDGIEEGGEGIGGKDVKEKMVLPKEEKKEKVIEIGHLPGPSPPKMVLPALSFGDSKIEITKRQVRMLVICMYYIMYSTLLLIHIVGERLQKAGHTKRASLQSHGGFAHG